MAFERRRLTIGALSGRGGVNVETIRYYERVGLLPSPPRTEGGHRLYGLEHLKRLASVRRSRGLGFSIEEIRVLLERVGSGMYTCGEVKTMTGRHLDNGRSKIADLRKPERTLAGVSSQREAGEVPECPVIDALVDD